MHVERDVDREGENREREREREREMEKGCEIRSAIEGLCVSIRVLIPTTNQDHDHHDSKLLAPPVVDTPDDHHDYVSTKLFLHASNLLLLQVLGKIGPSMAVLRQDVHQNIERLERIYESDPSINANLVEILKKEANDGIARKVSSCTRAMVWLTRSMDFTVALLDKLVKDPGDSMEQAVEESYNIALRPWHGWISSAAYKVALKLVPERKTFINLLMAEDKDHDMLTLEIKSLIALLLPLLDQIHTILIKFHCDRLKSA